jgi:hypothetical protein
MTLPTAREQFVRDYTLVTDNNYEAYKGLNALFEQQGSHSVSWLSDFLRDSFENRISEVVERERKRGNEYTADLIAEMLLGMGMDTFDKIATYYIDTDLETRLIKRLESVLKTEA